MGSKTLKRKKTRVKAFYSLRVEGKNRLEHLVFEARGAMGTSGTGEERRK